MKKIITLMIGIVILAVIVYYVGIESITNELSSLDLFYFALALISYLIVELLASLKLKLITKMGFAQTFLSNQSGMILSQITPGRIGYMFTAYSLAKKENSSISKKIGELTLIQGLMMSVKIVTMVVSLIYFSFYLADTEISGYLYLSFITPALAIIFILLLFSRRAIGVVSKIPYINKTVKYIDLIKESIKKTSKKTALKMVILDFIGWFFYGLVFFFLIKSLGLQLDFVTCLMLQPLITAVLFIPISPAALGVAETGSEVAFGMLGIDAGAGVAFLLIFRINAIIVDSIGLVDLRVIKIPKKIKELFF